MSSSKHVFFFNRKLNYWKLPWHQKVNSMPENFFYMVNFFACDKNVTNRHRPPPPPPLNFWICSAMQWFHGMKMKTPYWSWIKKSTIAKQKWNEQKTSYVSNISNNTFHPVLFKNEGTSTLRTSLKKNILEKDAAYIFVRKTFKIRKVP